MSTPDPTPASVRCAAILLAAGRGRRFDPTGHQDKLLQRMEREQTAVASRSVQASQVVAVRACASLAAGSDAVLAVVRPQAPAALQQALRDAGAYVTVCEEADLGMGHSLAHAVRDARARWPNLQALLVMPADMPWVRPSSVRAVAETLMAHSRRHHPEPDPGSPGFDRTRAMQAEGAQCAAGIVIPVTTAGQRGHPVGFDSRLFDALAALKGDAGARHLLQSAAVQRLVLDDPGIVRDVDTAQDLTPAART